MSHPIKSAAQVQKDDALIDIDSLRSAWYNAVADANEAADAFAAVENTASPNTVASAKSQMDAACDAADRAFKAYNKAVNL